jgi:hypothetical protein
MDQDKWAQLFSPGHLTVFTALFILLMIWSLVWKGFALWKAARNNDSVWFIVLMILNTMGILEIIYIYLIGKKKSA